MPHLLLHPHSRSRRAARPGRRGGLLAAGRARSPRARAPRPAPPQPASPPTRSELTGAGSTFDAPFFNLAFPAYQQAHPGVAVSYAAVGSSAGITRFTAGQVELRRHRRPRQHRRPGRRPRRPRRPGPGRPRRRRRRLQRADPQRHAPLRLTGPVLARIFLGQITKWDDPAITALNPGAAPARRLHHRRAPLRRQRHHLHLQQLPVRGQPRLGLDGRHRAQPALAGRHTAPTATPAWPPPSTASPTPSATSNAPTPPAPPSATPPSPNQRRQLHHAHPRRHHRRRRRQARHHPGRLLHRQRARPGRLPDLRLQLGPDLRPPAQHSPPGRPWSPSSAGSPTPGRPTPPPSATSPCPPPSSSSPPPPSPASPAPAERPSPADRPAGESCRLPAGRRPAVTVDGAPDDGRRDDGGQQPVRDGGEPVPQRQVLAVVDIKRREEDGIGAAHGGDVRCVAGRAIAPGPAPRVAARVPSRGSEQECQRAQ